MGKVQKAINSHTQVGAHPLRTESGEERERGQGEREIE